MNYFDKLVMPVHFKALHKWFDSREFKLLDIGCAGSGLQKAQRFLPGCLYYGLDRTRDDLSGENIASMSGFYEIDLEQSQLKEIPEDFFDAVLASHVLEHISNGEAIVSRLAKKVRVGGVMYIEFPNLHSLNVPSSRRDYLHFCDDPTHQFVHSTRIISNILMNNGYRIIRAGARRDPIRIILSPLFFLRGVVKGDPWTRTLYDLFGCVDLIFAIRVK